MSEQSAGEGDRSYFDVPSYVLGALTGMSITGAVFGSGWMAPLAVLMVLWTLLRLAWARRDGAIVNLHRTNKTISRGETRD